MSDLAVWGTGLGAAAAVVVAAAVMYAWHAYLRTRLPLAVYWKELDTCISELKGRREALAQDLKRLQEDLQKRWQEWTSLEAEIGEAKAWLQKNQEKVEQIPAMRGDCSHRGETPPRPRRDGTTPERHAPSQGSAA